MSVVQAKRITVGEAPETYPCLLCGLLFRRLEDAEDHDVGYHHFPINGGANFATIERRPKGKSSLVDSTATNGPRVSCLLCQKSLLKKSLRQHMQTHVSEKPYPCPLCDRGFIRKEGAMWHMITHHDGGVVTSGLRTLKIGAKQQASSASLVGKPSQERVRCARCGRTMRKKNMHKHLRGVHRMRETMS